MNSTFHAHCQCGQLKLNFTKVPVAQLVCHCQDCRTVSGKAFSQAAFFMAEANSETGAFQATEMTGGSGKSKQYRNCKSCGEFVYATVNALPGLLGVAADKLNAPFEFKPMAHVWTCEKADGVDIPQGVPQFPKAPPFRPGRH